MAGDATGTVCLQGGAEFGDACRDMDTEVLRRSGDGPVVVVALAAEPGRDHDTAVARATAYYRSLGAAHVVGAPDARSDGAGAKAAVDGAGLVVLPGGSPRRLLDGLRETGLDAALAEVLDAGAGVSGASAGAMVLCAWTVLPEGRSPALVPGLGVVPRSMALPHFTGDPRWLDAVHSDLPGDVTVLGLPECAGVIADGPGHASLTAVGDTATTLLGARTGELSNGEAYTV